MRKNRVCPVERAGSLDNRIRRWFQDPQQILQPYVHKGMTVLDLGCGPGFFSIEMARMVGSSGRVIASDLQEGMLQRLKNKIQGSEFENRMILHKCEEDRIGIKEPVDFILAFYVVHEILQQEPFFREIHSLLKPNGSILLAEPPFHVSKKAFQQTLEIAKKAGLIPGEGPKVLFSKTAVLTREKPIPGKNPA